MKPGTRIVSAALLLLVLILAACGADSDDETGATPTSGTSTEATAVSTPTAGAAEPSPTGEQAEPSPSTTDDDPYAQTIDWQPCGEGDTNECATVTVPIDYDDPSVGTTSIALLKAPASGTKIGTLFINPGGPGGSGVDMAMYWPSGVPAELSEAYDIIGFDPRGVGASDPLVCLDNAGLDELIAIDLDPETPEEEQQNIDAFVQMAEGCQETNGALVEHVTTVETARDLDVLRALVGDEKLNYFGASYGTFLGTTYAALFPDKVGRMVLDGAVDPSLSPLELALGQAGGFQLAFDAYVANCVESGACPLGETEDEIVTEIQDLFTQLDETPMPTEDPERPLTQSLAFYGISAPLYTPFEWTLLTSALQGALAGDGSGLLGLADLYNQRENGNYASNKTQANTAINCLDAPLKPEGTVPTEEQFVEASPIWGEILYAANTAYSCDIWPFEPSVEAPDYSAPGAAPILVVGTTRDPATPYESAVKLAEELESGVLLSRDGDGHTGFLQGNACVDDGVTAYLVDGTVPEDGTTCANQTP